MSTEAGGPLLYMSNSFATTEAGFEALMPEINDVDGDLVVEGTDEVQEVAITATGGTFTLTFGAQTTDPIAYNAAAATVQSALAALSTIGAGNVTVSGSAGGPYTVTFGGTLGSTNVALLTGDATSLTGDGAAIAISVVTPGVACAWDALAPIEDECAIAFLETVAKIRALDRGSATAGVVEERGVESVEVTYTDAGLDAMAKVIQGGTLSTVAAGASQVAQNVLKFGSALTALTYCHLMLVFPVTAAGYWRVAFVMKAAVKGNMTLTFNNKKLQLPTKFDVYAHEGFARTEDVMQWYEKTGDKTS